MENSKNKAIKAKLQLLLFQLEETLNDPPTVLDLIEWKENIEHIMNQISNIFDTVYDCLQDLVTEAVRRVEVHVQNLYEEAPPKEIEQSGHDYFQQVGFVISEINSLKSI